MNQTGESTTRLNCKDRARAQVSTGSCAHLTLHQHPWAFPPVTFPLQPCQVNSILQLTRRNDQNQTQRHLLHHSVLCVQHREEALKNLELLTPAPKCRYYRPVPCMVCKHSVDGVKSQAQVPVLSLAPNPPKSPSLAMGPQASMCQFPRGPHISATVS